MMLIIRLNCRNHRSSYSNIEICGQKKETEKKQYFRKGIPALMYKDLPQNLLIQKRNWIPQKEVPQLPKSLHPGKY